MGVCKSVNMKAAKPVSTKETQNKTTQPVSTKETQNKTTKQVSTKEKFVENKIPKLVSTKEKFVEKKTTQTVCVLPIKENAFKSFNSKELKKINNNKNNTINFFRS